MFVGGIGVIGGIRLSPKMLRDTISELKANLEDKNAPFGVDLLIPQVGGSARKTNVCTVYSSLLHCIHDSPASMTIQMVNCQS